MNNNNNALIQSIGHYSIILLASLGRVAIFLGQTLSRSFHSRIYVREIVKQMIVIGYYSLPIIGVTAIFTGMVLAFQSYTSFSRFAGESSTESAIAMIIVLSITRELAPVIGGLMLAGRAGARIASEIATMCVTEQIEALVTLSTHPLRYLVFPRLVASVIVAPMLVMVANVIGIYGGYLVCVYYLHFNAHYFLSQLLHYLTFEDIKFGLIKAAVFGFVIALVSCYHGYNATQGAQGVGRSTTQAVVHSSIFILLLNYVLTLIFFK